jgi:hypothetical protein
MSVAKRLATKQQLMVKRRDGLADKIGMTRFEPPQVSHDRSDNGAEAAHTAAHRRPRSLPGIRGMSVRRVIGEDGTLDRSLPWPSGTVVDVSPARGIDA